MVRTPVRGATTPGPTRGLALPDICHDLVAPGSGKSHILRTLIVCDKANSDAANSRSNLPYDRTDIIAAIFHVARILRGPSIALVCRTAWFCSSSEGSRGVSHVKGLVARSWQVAGGCLIAGAMVLAAQPAYAATATPASGYGPNGCWDTFSCAGPSEQACLQARREERILRHSRVQLSYPRIWSIVLRVSTDYY
jgi:hypothetical protein